MNKKILLVDDEPNALAALQRRLRRRFDLVCAGSGEEALELLESCGPFAAVVSDIEMPGMNGLQLLREMRRRAPEVVRLILTGHADLQAAIAAVNEGAVFRFHTKPVAADELTSSIESALLRHQVEKQTGGKINPDDDFIRTAGELRDALSNDQLRMFLQPQARLKDGTVSGAEALVRWEHPEKGLLGPGEFLDVAEAAGLMRDITFWMLDAACIELRRWRDLGIHHLHIAVNVTSMDLDDTEFPEQVAALLERHELPSGRLELELTEGAAVNDAGSARKTMTRLAEQGVALSIDDFGSGYSSLGWLRRLPVTKLKIDRLFIMDIDSDQDAYNLLETIVVLGRTLKLTVLAEGVENHAQDHLVTRAGCDLVQGFLLSRPMPAENFLAWLGKRSGVKY